MSKYVLHACPQRMWYVDEFLVPSLQQQGIDDIDIRCDKYKRGNLDHCMQIFSIMYGDGGTWHIQDDVIICRDFKKRTEEYESDQVVCGFVWDKDDNLNMVGDTLPKNMWWSFPCIYIPNHMALECSDWYYQWAKYQEKYLSFSVGKQYDDYFFIEFLKNNYSEKQVLQVKPCLVDHIDYLIGGTTVKRARRDDQCRAAWFDDPDLVDDLADKIRRRNNG